MSDLVSGITKEEVKVNWQEIRQKSMKRAFGGGVAGSCAMICQVGSLMWLRTTMNYQYRNGTTTTQALKHLYNDGGRGLSGIRRFYRGIGPGLLQGPLSRFGDTAANTGMLTIMNSHPNTKELPTAVKTLGASVAAASWRIFLMPIDASKTILQVEGKDGLQKLRAKVAVGGPRVLWHGALAASGATFVGHFPWFVTFNMLDEHLPKADPNSVLQKFGRRAVMGFVSSVISDTTSNSIRVIKTFKQTATVPISYPDAARMVIKKDGYIGLFGRGLKTRILANGVQGLMFSVLWKSFEELLFKKE